MALLGELGALFTAAWDAIQPANLPELPANLQSLATQAIGFLQGVWDFAVTVAVTVLQLIKDSLLGWLRTYASDIPATTAHRHPRFDIHPGGRARPPI
jgi:hypothetical protein